MSKGPGSQQRRILSELENRPCFYLAELWAGGTRAESVALIRAAWKLEAAGKVSIERYLFGPERLVVARRGYCVTERPPPLYMC